MKGRIIAIGDIHGCHEEFAELLRRLKLTRADRLILLGDLINRGPDSRAVIDLARAHRAIALLEKFSAAMGGRTCEEILGVNVSSQAYKDDPQRAQQLRAERCVKAVATAARIADELI